MNTIETIKKDLAESAKVKKDLIKQAPLIDKIAKEAIAALKKGGKVIVFGNGGSAADSQHMVAELIGRFRREKRPLPAVSLAANISILTAIGNDYGFQYSFSKQLEALGAKHDIIFAISTSGNSKNVIEAVLAAKKMGAKTVGLSGRGGGQLSKIAGLSLVVPSDNTARIQEAHITAIHIICGLIEEAFIR
jgi:D-sedoheptulose 7-phosphate isomerase